MTTPHDDDTQMNDAVQLPDGSGFMLGSFPLPKDHWLYAAGENEPPMPFRIGAGAVRDARADIVRDAARYAIRCATMNGAVKDWDPDAMVQAFVVGMMGYNTLDGTFDSPAAGMVAKLRSEDTEDQALRFEELAREKPEEFMKLLAPGELEPHLLTFAAEIAGRALETAVVVPILLTLLEHESAVVREGAVRGLSWHLNPDTRVPDVEERLRALAAEEPSVGVRAAIVDTLTREDDPS